MAHRYFLVYFIFTSCTVAGQSPKYALRGLKVHLKGDITGQPDEILWKHKGNKVVQLSGNQEQVYGVFKNRITLNEHTAELDITDLRYEDSGEYVLEAYKKNVLSTSTFQLEVIDKVSTPTISCEMNEGSSSDKSGTQATLMCSAESRQPQLMKFEWSSGGNVQPDPTLTISLGEKHDDEEYSCTVSNPLSSETATFTAKNCNPEKSVPVAGIVIGVIFGIIFQISCILAIIFYIQRRKAHPETGKTNGNQSPRGSTEVLGLDKTTDQEEESRPLCEPSEHKEDADLHQVFVEPSPGSSSSCKKRNEPDAKSFKEKAALLSEEFKRKTPRMYSVSGSEKEVDEDGGAQPPPASAETFPAALPRARLTKSSQNVAPNDTAGEHKGESGSVRESDSSGIHEKRHKSEDSAEEEQLPTVPKQTSNFSQDTRKDDQQEPEKTVFKVENESGGVGEGEERKEDTSKQPQRPTPRKRSDRNNDTFQESPGTADPDPEEGETRDDSGFGVSGSEKEADEDERAAQSPPASAEPPPAVQPRSPLTKSSPNVAPNDTAGEHEEESGSVRESDSSGIHEKINEPEDSAEEEQFPTVPDQRGPKTSVHEQDSNFSQDTRKDDQQQPGVGEGEERKEDTSKQPQRPTPRKRSNRNIDSFQESPGTADPDPEEGETRDDADDFGGQSDKSTAEADTNAIARRIRHFESMKKKEEF